MIVSHTRDRKPAQDRATAGVDRQNRLRSSIRVRPCFADIATGSHLHDWAAACAAGDGAGFSIQLHNVMLRRDGVVIAQLWQVIEAARHRAMVDAPPDRRGANGAGYGPARVRMDEEGENNSSTA